MKQIYQAEGIAAAVDFHLHPAIRTAGDPKVDRDYLCPDEDVGCPMTKFVLCALNSTETTVDERVSFLTCWDEGTEEPESRAKSCAAQAKLEWKPIYACASGAQGAQLQQDAAQYYEDHNPSFAHKGIFNIPHCIIGGRNVFNTQYSFLLKAVCNTGIKAGACQAPVVV